MSGLYVSFDAGKNWNKWTNGYPTVPTSDLVIHPRDHDLVIGTFGRSFWILDDIRPLRALAKEGKKLLKEEVYAFEAPEAIQAIRGESHGYREGKVGDFLYKGENRPFGAIISYYLSLDEKLDEKLPLNKQVKIEIFTAESQKVKTIYQKPENGFNRVNWDLTRDGLRMPMVPKPTVAKASGRGIAVSPGLYEAKISYNGKEAFTIVNVVIDPRLEVKEELILRKENMIQRHLELVSKATEMADQIRDLEKSLKFVGTKMNDLENDELKEKMKSVKENLQSLKEDLLGKEKQGIYRDPAVVVSALFQTQFLLADILNPPSANQENQMKIEKEIVDGFVKRFEAFMDGEVKELKGMVEAVGIGVF